MTPLLSQTQIVVVDGTGLTQGAFPSITDAVASSPPGTKIFVKGMVLDGSPVGYCESPYFPSQNPETFPIHLKPGMTLQSSGSQRPYLGGNFDFLAKDTIFAWNHEGLDLTVNGGSSDGHAGANQGWDIGIAAATADHPQSVSPTDYYGAYHITMNGAEIKAFRVAGVYGSVAYEHRARFDFNGQSSVTGTGGAGIWAFASTEVPSCFRAIVNVRFVNDFVWNNGGGAFLGQLKGDDAYLLTPLEHCTMVGNATTSPDHTVEVQLLTPSTPGLFEWWEKRTNATSTSYTHMRLVDSIFQRDPNHGTTGGNDFGPGLSSLKTYLTTNGGGFVGLISIAGRRSFPSLPSSYELCTVDNSPFAATVDLQLTLPEQLFLYGTLTSSFDKTPASLHLYAPEVDFDYNLSPRPPISTGDQDKGAYQAQ